ncbi:MAG: hypothetical protein ABI355_04815 [Solirubrobacteraceae bacterium]
MHSGAELSRAVSAVLTTALVVTNLIGAAVVLAVIYLILPLPPVRDAAAVRQLNAIVAAAYIVFAVITGALGGRALLADLQRWLCDDRPADGSVQRLVVRAPLFLFGLQVGLWLTAAAVFGVLDSVHSARLGLAVAATVALTGVTTNACAYLVAERILRKPASRALADEGPGRPRVPGVATRAVLAWAFGLRRAGARCGPGRRRDPGRLAGHRGAAGTGHDRPRHDRRARGAARGDARCAGHRRPRGRGPSSHGAGPGRQLRCPRPDL